MRVLIGPTAALEWQSLEGWIPITIAAAFCQNLRSVLQKQLTGRLSVGGATATRFFFAMPFAITYVLTLHYAFGYRMPAPDTVFFAWCVAGGLGQIIGTQLLVGMFAYRNFAVGTAYSKTETVQAALFGVVALHETVSVGGAIAILVSLIGLFALSIGERVTPAALLASVASGVARRGLASGAAFAVAAVAYRAASTSLADSVYTMSAAYTLAWVTVLQSVAMGLWLARREPGETTKLLGAWRQATWVGLSGMLASAGWFTAMTLERVAYVRALGQIELVFTFLSAVLWFRERVRPNEAVGIALLVVGILLLLTAR